MLRCDCILAVVLAFLTSCTGNEQKKVQSERLTDFVDPFIGTASHGYIYPGAAYPYGQIQTTMYKNTPDGLCGNENCGQMSAWYIFSSLGFTILRIENKFVFQEPVYLKNEIMKVINKKEETT